VRVFYVHRPKGPGWDFDYGGLAIRDLRFSKNITACDSGSEPATGFPNAPLKRMQGKADISSGANPRTKTFPATFNPLFPKGNYLVFSHGCGPAITLMTYTRRAEATLPPA